MPNERSPPFVQLEPLWSDWDLVTGNLGKVPQGFLSIYTVYQSAELSTILNLCLSVPLAMQYRLQPAKLVFSCE